MRVSKRVAAGVAGATVVVAVGGFALANNGGGGKGIGRSPSGSNNAPAPAPAPNTNTGLARVPHNNIAYIYNLFGANPVESGLLDQLRQRLVSEGYTVNVFADTTEGAGSQGSATLANFTKMADDGSVIIFNGHGFDLSGNTQTCSEGKSINRCAKVVDPTEPPADSTASSTDSAAPASGSVQPGVGPQGDAAAPPGLQVEWYPTWRAEREAYQKYLAQGIDPSWLIEPESVQTEGHFWASTLAPWRPGDGFRVNDDGTVAQPKEGMRPWLGISKAGIAHFFQGHQVDLIDVMACHSISVASSFSARAVFAHASTACEQFETDDEPLLFKRLVGEEGVPKRSTAEAMAAGGFKDQFFQLSPESQPVVLSPTVESVTPTDGSRVGQNATTPIEVRFDAEMNDKNAADVVTVSGCGATIKNAQWPDNNRLTFNLAIPDKPVSTEITVTVHKDQAKAPPGDFPNQQLDGNSDPADQSGVAPNRDDYVYTLSCSTAPSVRINYKGTFQADYTNGTFSYHTHYTWDETQPVALNYTDGHFVGSTPGQGKLTAVGTVTASGTQPPPDDDCTFFPAKPPHLKVLVNTGQEVGDKRTINLMAQMPIDTDFGGRNDNQLTFSGTCSVTSSPGVYPYLHQNPLGGVYDPGGKLQLATAGEIDNVDVDQLQKTPVTMQFPVDYTQTDLTGGTEHVVVSGTVTVSFG